MHRKTKRRLLSVTGVASLVLGYQFVVAPALREEGVAGLSVPVRAPAASADALRIANWNLRNFDGVDDDDMLDTLRELDASVLALQEVNDPAALAAGLSGYTVIASRTGGSGDQHLAIAVDPARVEVLGPPLERTALSLGGRVRPLFGAHLRERTSGQDVLVLVVHLKAREDGHAMRREQWATLRAELSQLAATVDTDIVLLGDFNTTGQDGDEASEVAALTAALSVAGLRRLPTHPPCTAYWDGDKRDAVKEPSVLDHVFVAGLERAQGASVRALGHCARHRCEPLRSTRAHPDGDYGLQSDHCPLVVDLPAPR